MTKPGTAIGGLLLIGALVAPVAFAHYDHKVCPPTERAFMNAPLCSTDPSPQDLDRVAGWYSMSTNVWMDANGPMIDNPLNPQQGSCPGDAPMTPVNENAACVFATSDISPDLLDFASWSGLYDVEVGGLGACLDPSNNPTKSDEDEAIEDALTATAVLNEIRVDAAPGLGLMPDGLHNDGGYGAVGHTFGHYDCNGGADDTSNWETAGCDHYDQAFAEDLVSGGIIWIGAQCNWGVPITNGQTPPLTALASQFANDAINCPLGGLPRSCFDAIQYFDDCIGIDLVSQTLMPSSDWGNRCGGTSGNSIVCGAGRVSDIDFGYGRGTVGAGTDASYPNAGSDTNGNPCDAYATATAFPFTQVVATVIVDPWCTCTPFVRLDWLAPATHGWVA